MRSLRRLYWRLAPPKEVTVTSARVRAFLEGINEPFLPGEVERYAVILAKNAERTIYSIRNDDRTPDQLALILITNVIAKLLPSGQYHNYRGVLSGRGQSMLRVFQAAVDALAHERCLLRGRGATRH